MYLKDDICELEIKSVDKNNMSNWQITHTVDTLTTVNNKFDVLHKVNDLLNQGVKKKNIFVTDKSFLISTNYKTYFEKGDVLKYTSDMIVKIANIGRIITMEENEDIVKINCLMSYYKRINSLLNNSLKCRLRGVYLSESYRRLFNKNLKESYDYLTNAAQEQIRDMYGRFLSPDYIKMNKLLEKLNQEKDKQLEKNEIQFKRWANESVKRFEHTFNRFDRPVIGVYDELHHSFQIINSDQMYRNGEESENQLRLKSITKNSPVTITVLVTGAMLSLLGYLVYRDHSVNKEIIDDNMLDIPQDSREVIENVFTNENGEIIDINATDKKKLDPQLTAIIEKNLNKLEIISNNKKVHLEMKDTNINITS